MCEYEYEYLIIAWVRVRVLVDEYEHEYRHMIYILYKEQHRMPTLVSGHQQLYIIDMIDVLLQEHPNLSSVWKD